jgi:hypothetical protein
MSDDADDTTQVGPLHDFEHEGPGRKVREPEWIVREPDLLQVWEDLYGASGPSIFELPGGGYGVATENVDLLGFRVIGEDTVEFCLWEKHMWGIPEGMTCAFHAPVEHAVDWALEMKSHVLGEKKDFGPDSCLRRGRAGRYWLVCNVRYMAVQFAPSPVEMELADTILYVVAKKFPHRTELIQKIFFGLPEKPTPASGVKFIEEPGAPRGEM